MTTYSADKSKAYRAFASQHMGVLLMIPRVRDNSTITKAFATGFTAIMLLLLAACSTGRDELVAGRQYKGLIKAGSSHVQVPLPEGSWTLIAWENYSNEQKLGGVLIETKGNNVSRLVDFYVPQLNTTYWYLRPNKFCGRNDILHVGKSEFNWTFKGMPKNHVSPHDCWGVNHWPMTFSGSIPNHILALRDYVEANGLVLPSTMIGVHYRRGGNGQFFSLNYYFNPELESFPPPEQVEWRTSDWHRDIAFHDPQKKAYIGKLIKWGEAWHAQVDRGFRGLLKRGSP
jgi:hypothetical protein